MVDVIPDHVGVLVLGCRLQFQPLVVGGVVGIAGVSGVERDSLGVMVCSRMRSAAVDVALCVQLDRSLKGGLSGVRSARPLSGK